MLEMIDIGKSFPLAGKSVDVLRGISLFISRGEYVSIMGPSGSGKSTLSSILGCLATPSSGVYRIDGQDVSALNSFALSSLRNRQIGFIFQDFNLLEGMNATDNVALPLFYAGVPARERRARAVASLKKVGLESRKSHMPNQLSGGQKQRVAIARALVTEPAFLFADEPTGALDKRTGHEIMGLIQKLNLMGHTVVQVTHSSSDANYSKRILYLVDGLIVKDELVERPTIGALAEGAEIDKQSELHSRLWQVAQHTPLLSTENFSVIRDLFDKTRSQEALVEAVKAIVRWDGPDADLLVSDLFHHEFWPVRAEMLRACSSRPRDFVLPFCFAALTDENAWVRFLAIQNIKRSGLTHFKPEWEKAIADSSKDPDERVRATAVMLMGQMKEDWLFPVLASAIEDRDGRVRANALEAIAFFLRSGDQQTVSNILKKHLDDKNNRARANAAVLLAGTDMRLAVDTLRLMIAGENNLMRASAAWGLGCIKNDEAGNLLLEVLKTEKDELVLAQVVRALGKTSRHSLSLRTQFHRLLEAA